MDCWLAFGACLFALGAAYYVVRQHAKLDGTSRAAVFQQAHDATQMGLYFSAAVLVLGWGIKTFILPGLVGIAGTVCVAFITGICGGYTFEQVKTLLCILGEMVSGRLLESCTR